MTRSGHAAPFHARRRDRRFAQRSTPRASPLRCPDLLIGPGTWRYRCGPPRSSASRSGGRPAAQGLITLQFRRVRVEDAVSRVTSAISPPPTRSTGEGGAATERREVENLMALLMALLRALLWPIRRLWLRPIELSAEIRETVRTARFHLLAVAVALVMAIAGWLDWSWAWVLIGVGVLLIDAWPSHRRAVLAA